MGELPMPTQEAVIPFAPASTSTTSGNADKLDRAGQTILQLLNRAASRLLSAIIANATFGPERQKV
jgi:hypothetical protein